MGMRIIVKIPVFTSLIILVRFVEVRGGNAIRNSSGPWKVVALVFLLSVGLCHSQTADQLFHGPALMTGMLMNGQ